MSNFIESALKRKQEMNPQMDYMWRVDLPDLSDVIDQRTAGERANDRFKEETTGFWGGAKSMLMFIPTAGKVAYSALFDNDIASQDEVNHRVTSFDVPFPNFAVKKVDSIGVGWKAAAGTEISTISMKLLEYEDGASLKYITGWMGAVQTEEGTYNPPSLYKKKISLIRMSSSGMDLHVSTCIGCFPIEVATVSHSYESNAITQYNVTMSVDTIEHKIIPYDTILRQIEKLQIEIANSPTNPFSSVFDYKRHFYDMFGV